MVLIYSGTLRCSKTIPAYIRNINTTVNQAITGIPGRGFIPRPRNSDYGSLTHLIAYGLFKVAGCRLQRPKSSAFPFSDCLRVVDKQVIGFSDTHIYV